MKNTIFVIIGSALLHFCVCLIEWFVWNFIPVMNGFDGYNLHEKGFFFLLFIAVVMTVCFLIKGETIFVNMMTFWLAFAFMDRVIGLRELVSDLANNIYIYQPNFLGDDTWAACYIGCIVGTIFALI